MDAIPLEPLLVGDLFGILDYTVVNSAKQR